MIEVTTSFFFLAFVLHFCKVFVALNGQPAQQRWGTVAIPVAPGRYQVEAWTNYFIAPEMGRNGVVVDAMPGTVTRVRWKAPWLIFLKGSITVTEVAPLAPGMAPAVALPNPPAPPRRSARPRTCPRRPGHCSTAGARSSRPATCPVDAAWTPCRAGSSSPVPAFSR